MAGRTAKAARKTAQEDRRRHNQERKQAFARNGLIVAAAGVALVLVVFVLSRFLGGGSAVTAIGSSQGNQLHQFSGDHHAPFISMADYKPIYDRHDPNYVLVDVREAAERARMRIPGDIWIPLADADATGWKALLPYKDKMIVLYCDCPWAEAAKESVILEAHGLSDSHLLVLHEGIPGWYQAGYPIDVTDSHPCVTEQNWPQACGG